MLELMVSNMEVRENILADEKYKYLFSVEEVNRLVLQGIPFREAYRQIGDAIGKGDFDPPRELHHTHEGSIGNLCNDKIQEHLQQVLNQFKFEQINRALQSLLGN
jgi:argininosuccinate lyase